MTVGSSKLTSIISTVVSTLGTGPLMMPSSFHALGYYYGIAVLSLVGFATFLSIYALSYAAIATELKTASYSNLARSFSNTWKVLLDITLIGSNFGSSVYISSKFMRYAALSISKLFNTTNYSNIIENTALFFLVSLAFIFISKKDISALNFLAKISISSVICYLLVTIGSALKSPVKMEDLSKTSSNFSAAANFILALHCQFSWLDIFNNLADKSMSGCCIVGGVASILLIIIYSCSGFFGYRAVGPEISKDLMLDIFLNSDSILMKHLSGQTGLAKMLWYGTYLSTGAFLLVWCGSIIFMGYPCVGILCSWIDGLRGVGKKNSTEKPIARHYAAIAYACLLYAMCWLRQEIDVVIGVVSAVFTNSLSFFFSSIFLVKVCGLLTLRGVLGMIFAGLALFLIPFLLPAELGVLESSLLKGLFGSSKKSE